MKTPLFPPYHYHPPTKEIGIEIETGKKIGREREEERGTGRGRRMEIERERKVPTTCPRLARRRRQRN